MKCRAVVPGGNEEEQENLMQQVFECCPSEDMKPHCMSLSVSVSVLGLSLQHSMPIHCYRYI